MIYILWLVAIFVFLVISVLGIAARDAEWLKKQDSVQHNDKDS